MKKILSFILVLLLMLCGVFVNVCGASQESVTDICFLASGNFTLNETIGEPYCDNNVVLVVYYGEDFNDTREYGCVNVGNGIYKVSVPDIDSATQFAFYHPAKYSYDQSYYFVEKQDSNQGNDTLADLGFTNFSDLDGIFLYGMIYNADSHFNEFDSPRLYYNGKACKYSDWIDAGNADFEFGDVNGDKKLNIRDATAIQKYAASLIEFTPTELFWGDVNADGNVDVKDATAIQKHIAGLIDIIG